MSRSCIDDNLCYDAHKRPCNNISRVMRPTRDLNECDRGYSP